MTSIETELKLLFPTVTKFKNSDTNYVGIFKTKQNENVFATFNVPNFPQASRITFESSVNLNEEIFQSLIAQSDNINFLEFLKLFQQALANAQKQCIVKSHYIAKFYHEFRALKQQYPYEKFIFNENETLKIIYVDDYSVKNEIIVKLGFSEEDSNMYEVVQHSFPPPKDIKLFHKQFSLTLLHKQFLKYVNDLAQFHDVIQRIDSTCWVISPSVASYEHDYRTIIIGENNLSVKIIFDPWQMHKIPQFHFFGSTKVIEECRTKLNENLFNWESNSDVLQNILNVLDLPFFPVKVVEDEKKTNDHILYDSDTECCICFSLYLNNEIPNIICDNNSCRRHFHNECLYEWLSRLPNPSYLDSLKGECPNCNQAICCKIPEK